MLREHIVSIPPNCLYKLFKYVSNIFFLKKTSFTLNEKDMRTIAERFFNRSSIASQYGSIISDSQCNISLNQTTCLSTIEQTNKQQHDQYAYFDPTRTAHAISANCHFSRQSQLRFAYRQSTIACQNKTQNIINSKQ